MIMCHHQPLTCVDPDNLATTFRVETCSDHHHPVAHVRRQISEDELGIVGFLVESLNYQLPVARKKGEAALFEITTTF